MSKLCQDCYTIARPNDYFPETFISGECDGCGQTAFVARVTKDEVELVKATRLRWADDFDRIMMQGKYG